jgi:post-segregation antitoxin (ccd killing protein)
MSNGWSSWDYKLTEDSIIVPEESDDLVVSKEISLSAGGASRALVVKLAVSDVTVTTAISAMLQTAEGDQWEDSKSVSITQDGNFYIKLLATNADDQEYLPLLNKARVIITSGTDDLVTIDKIAILQEL